MVQIVTLCHACHAFHAIGSPTSGSRDSHDIVLIVSFAMPCQKLQFKSMGMLIGTRQIYVKDLKQNDGQDAGFMLTKILLVEPPKCEQLDLSDIG